ncbi:hypothetical protein BB559_000427 [Furculomyces boomerangus]|uniref:Very-long-chain (3R)-3-hydroxyacyl-CoA dehydratase n=2 Tax=Harpellales TaxID=61421 RepID=A0A2T9Z5C8_9FUNG|nr:hypothetical protein BB559_000427 [Furculomyces boomerangus]PWA00700.1 hypothetical protein BB558_003243 [Smittium angustum]
MAVQKKSIKKQDSKPSSFVQNYLIGYNVVSGIAWAYIFKIILTHMTSGNSYKTLFNELGSTLIGVQTVAVLEILHSAVGFVKSSILTTFIQMFARLYMCWGVLYLFPEESVTQSFGFLLLTTAWSVTEIVRYSYYAAAIMNIDFYPLLWARYTFFYVLYPAGFVGELLEVFASLSHTRAYSQYLYYLYIVLATLYPPGLYFMYTYMIKQRKKQLNPTVKRDVESSTPPIPRSASKKKKL